MTGSGEFTGEFRRNLKGSEFQHWGEGTLAVSRNAVAARGRLAPGPECRLYLSPEFAETGADFLRLQPGMVRVGEVRTFNGFVVSLPANADRSDYTTVIVWCESFGQFITAARYR